MQIVVIMSYYLVCTVHSELSILENVDCLEQPSLQD